MKTSTVSLTFLTALLLVVPVWAENETMAGTPLPTPETVADRGYSQENQEQLKGLLRRFDRNGDGHLDETERAEAEKARQLVERNGGMEKYRQRALQRFDKNGDGKLDATEQAAVEQYRAQQVRKFDRDGDGRLNETEKAEALKEFMGGPRPAKAGARKP